MTVRPEAKMDEVEDNRRTGYLLQSQGIAPGRGIQIRCFHRHGIHLLRAYRSVVEQAFSQMRQVPVVALSGCDALVHLHQMQSFPRNILVRQRAQHEPWSLAAAKRCDKATARSHGRTSVGCDQPRGFLGDGFGIRKQFDFHRTELTQLG